MNYQTIIQKGQDGWNAKSEAVLGETPEGTRILSLRTSKTRGGLASTASVSIRSVKNGYAVDTTVLFEDFLKSNIAPTPCSRITEKAIELAHQAALAYMSRFFIDRPIFAAVLSIVIFAAGLIAIPMLPIILGYTAYVYWLFRAKVSDEASYH